MRRLLASALMFTFLAGSSVALVGCNTDTTESKETKTEKTPGGKTETTVDVKTEKSGTHKDATTPP